MLDEILKDTDGEDALARVYQALGEPTRLRILRLLAQHDGLSCGEMTERLGINCSTLSHHLALLHDAGLVGRHKRGTFRIYRIHRQALDRYAPVVA
ncbi:MAG TPA: metalloregulator ArsR/SmtB family transcription factor [Chloroflexota bacterium]|jgi:DNA-binding transcriptional ArsR family regulator|nr:metalloregulator ArsR/SmtB family transcription factor [Chloroflexota bacterium]